jgi:uncharacterized membrane protein YkvA (DUF1232 family)
METTDTSKERNIGELIKYLLKKHSLSMRKFSSLCGMDVATVSRIVNRKQQPKLVHLKLFSEYLHISLDKLIEASGYKVDEAREDGSSDIRNSFDDILEMLRDSKLFDPKVTRARIEQELAKYEQYAQTEEGHRLICQEFNAKVTQVNGVGPFIEHLKDIYSRYCNKDTSIHDRSVLGSALLYFILSTDIIPDYIFPIGYVDDAIAVHLVLERLNQTGYTA